MSTLLISPHQTRYDNFQKNSGFGIGSLFVLLSLASAIIIAINDSDRNDSYSWMPVLPVSYGVVSAFLCANYKYFFKSITFTIISSGYFVKMVLYPLLSSLGNYLSFFSGYVQVIKIKEAIIYFSIEYLIIMFVFYTSLSDECTHYSRLQLENTIYSTKTFSILIALLSGYLVFSYLYVEELRTIYYLPTDIKIEELASIRWDNETIVARGSIKRYIYTLFLFIWPLVRYLLPVSLILKIYKKYNKTSKSVFLSGLCCFIPCIFLGGDNFAPFVAVAITLLVIRMLYGQHSNKLFSIVLIIIVLILIVVISSKLTALSNWRGANGVANIAQLLNAYFPGVENMALCMQIDAPNKLDTLFYDIYSGIPFAATLFGLNGESFNTIYNSYTSTGGQIVPFSGNIGYYTSYILSPVVFAWVISIAIKYEKKAKQSCEYWIRYVYLLFSTYTSMSAVIYSSQIYIRFLFNVMVPILLIRFVARLRIDKSKE